MASYDRGVKASGRARKHMRSCAGCREYRTALRGMRRSFAALTPVGAGLFGSIAASLGIGGGGAAAGGAAAGGGGVAATAAGGTLATATACKVAAVVCTAALTAGGAVEVRKLKRERAAPRRQGRRRGRRPRGRRPPRRRPCRCADQPVLHRTMSQPVTPAAPKADARAAAAKAEQRRRGHAARPTGAPGRADGAETTPPVDGAGRRRPRPTRTGGDGAPPEQEPTPVGPAPARPRPATTAAAGRHARRRAGTRRARADGARARADRAAASQPSSGRRRRQRPPSEH